MRQGTHGDVELRDRAPPPAHRQPRGALTALEVDRDVLQEGAQKLLAVAIARGRGRPDGTQIRAQTVQLGRRAPPCWRPREVRAEFRRVEGGHVHEMPPAVEAVATEDPHLRRVDQQHVQGHIGSCPRLVPPRCEGRRLVRAVEKLSKRHPL